MSEKVNLEVSKEQYDRLVKLLEQPKTESIRDQEPLPEDAVPVGEKLTFWHVDRAENLIRSKGSFRILTGLRHLSNAGGLIRRMDDKFRGVQDKSDDKPCDGIEFYGKLKPKVRNGRSTKGFEILVRKSFPE
jgi:hypothetical protein